MHGAWRVILAATFLATAGGAARGAREPSLGEQLVEEAYLKASNAEAGDWFGWSLAASGDTVVVGARREDSVGTSPADNSAPWAGAVYVFVRDGAGWSQQAYLKASNAERNDQFGQAVAIDGDTLVVGAWMEDSGASGVNGNQADASAQDSGAVYVFVRDGTSWSQQAYLKASNTGAADRFGCSVAISGDTLVVGAFLEDSGSTGVNGNQADNGRLDSGAAYVFVRNGTSWSQQAYLKASNTGVGDQFGCAVAIEGDTLAVGACFEDSNATGVGGNQGSNSAPDAGAVYVFVRNGTTWSQQAYLKASNTGAGDEFGSALALFGDTLAVGAWAEDGGASGVNGPEADESAPGAGAAYVFTRNGSTWSQQAYLKASNTDPYDDFGWSLALLGERLVVGAPGEASAASGVDGDQQSNAAVLAGAAYVFVRDGTSWSQEAYLKGFDSDPFDTFGWSVALSDEAVLVGALLEDGGQAGVNGDPADDEALDAGAVFVFSSGGPSPIQATCFGAPALCPCANGGLAGRGCDNAQATGGVGLSAIGTPSANDVVLHGTGFPVGSTPGVVVIRSPNAEASPLAFGDGIRCVGALGLVRLGATNAVGGASTHPLNHGAGPGTFHYQLWYRNTPASFCDPAAGFNLSNGLSILWP